LLVSQLVYPYQISIIMRNQQEKINQLIDRLPTEEAKVIQQLQEDSKQLRQAFEGDVYGNGQAIALVAESMMHFMLYEINAGANEDIRMNKGLVLIEHFKNMVAVNRYVRKTSA
jgi:predicted RNase H-like nuclease (RuvC/YqgF family)